VSSNVFPQQILNRLRLAGDVTAEVASTLPECRALVLITPQVDPELAEWDQVSRCWRRIYVEENILAGFQVNHIEIETLQIEQYYDDSMDIDLEPTINERFYVRSEDELANLVLRWMADLSEFRSYLPNRYPLVFDL